MVNSMSYCHYELHSLYSRLSSQAQYFVRVQDFINFLIFFQFYRVTQMIMLLFSHCWHTIYSLNYINVNLHIVGNVGNVLTND